MFTPNTVASQVSKYMANAVTISSIWGSILYNVKESPYLAKGDGITNDSSAIQAAINAAIAAGSTTIYFPPGTYVASGLTNTTVVNFVGDGASFVNNTYYIFAYGTQSKSQLIGKGQNSGNIFVSTQGTHKEIADTDSVAIQSVIVAKTLNSINYDRVWGFNTLVSKWIDTASSYVCGIEASMANETTDHTDVIGVLSSYVGLTQGAKSAFESTGNTAGWTYGLLLDAIKTTGTAIVLEDNVSVGGGMAVGLDTRPVASFSTGAIVLGNGHNIVANDGAGGNTAILFTNGGITGFRVAGSTGNLVIQNKLGTSTYLRAGVNATNAIEIWVNGALKTVEVGAVDTGGAGYRMLRVLN